jgi:hypothetical protein
MTRDKENPEPGTTGPVPEREDDPQAESPADRGEGKTSPLTPGKAEGERQPDNPTPRKGR